MGNNDLFVDEISARNKEKSTCYSLSLYISDISRFSFVERSHPRHRYSSRSIYRA